MDNIKNIRKNQTKPKKRLGQNFLMEDKIIEKLIRAAEINSEEIILEIGPGTGNLTQKLLETSNQVLAIEKDRQLVSQLKIKFLDKPNLELQEGDILKFDETTIQRPYKIVANLPFYLTGRLLRKFLESKIHQW